MASKPGAKPEAKPRAKPKALVTGGAGFLGSHLCERLLAEGYRVVCMDNLRTGTLENVANLEGEADFEFVDHDVSAPDITRAREVPGWEPRVPVREGLKKTIEWFAGRSSRHAASPARR